MQPTARIKNAIGRISSASSIRAGNRRIKTALLSRQIAWINMDRPECSHAAWAGQIDMFGRLAGVDAQIGDVLIRRERDAAVVADGNCQIVNRRRGGGGRSASIARKGYQADPFSVEDRACAVILWAGNGDNPVCVKLLASGDGEASGDGQ